MQAFGDTFGVGNIGVFYAISAWDYRVLSSREEGLFPVVDKSNFFQTFLTRSTSLLIWSETNTSGNVPLWSFLHNCSIWECMAEQPPNYLGYCDKVVHVVTKPATSLSEQFNWSHVIKTTNRKLGILVMVPSWLAAAGGKYTCHVIIALAMSHKSSIYAALAWMTSSDISLMLITCLALRTSEAWISLFSEMYRASS